jgi:hypothetical protein
VRIILPKKSCHIDLSYGPPFFLAGPVLGGDDWQHRCTGEIWNHIKNFYAAIPSRYAPDHSLMRFRAPDSNHAQYGSQLEWERFHLDLAYTMGCVIFWLPCESRTNSRTDGNPYARDSYGELGELRGRMMHDHSLRVVVGAEANFPGLNVIQRNFNLALRRRFPIYTNLTDTVQAAMQIVNRNRS